MRAVKLRSNAFVLAPRNATRVFFFFMPTNLLDTNCFGTIFQGAVNFSEVYVSLLVVGWIVTGTAQFY